MFQDHIMGKLVLEYVQSHTKINERARIYMQERLPKTFPSYLSHHYFMLYCTNETEKTL